MKKLLGLLGVATMALALTSCGGEVKDEKAFVSLDINPDIELIVDGDNKVVDYYLSNTDAKVMMHAEGDLKGMSLDAAIEKVASLSIEMGYLSEENHVLEYTISSNMSSKKLGKMESSINASFDKEAKKASLDIKCNMEPTFTLDRQLEELKNKYKDVKEIQDLTVEKYKLVLAAMASDFKLKLMDAVKMDELELIGVVEDSRDEAYNYATKAYNEAMVYADKAFNVAKSAFTTAAYSGYYVKNYKEHKVNYGLIYGTYQGARTTLEGILKTSYLVDSYTKKILTPEEIEAIKAELIEAKLLAEAEADKLKDENGNITIDSINAYVDKKIKNMSDKELSDALLNLKAEINNLENSINALIDSIALEYKDELMAIATSIKGVTTALAGVAGALIPDDIKEIMATYKSELTELSNVIIAGCKGEMTLDNMKDYIKLIEDKEAKVLAQINNDLTAEEKAELNSILEKSTTEYNNAKTAFKNALDSAKAASDKRLEELKANRK